jgi:hypothetical protein
MTRSRLLPLLALTATACAHTPSSPAAPPEACREDAARLCSTEPFLIPCLQSQKDALSAACRLAMATPAEVAANPQQANEEFSTACATDSAALCPGVKPDEGKLLDCLRVQSLSLGEPCQIAVNKALELNSQFKAACGSEAARLCPFIQPGQGRIIACMKSRKAELDFACSNLVFPQPAR